MTPAQLIAFIETSYKKESGFRVSPSKAIGKAKNYLGTFADDAEVLADPKSLWGLVKVLAADSRLHMDCDRDTSATARVLVDILMNAQTTQNSILATHILTTLKLYTNQKGKDVFKSAYWITQPDTTQLTAEHWQLIQNCQSPVNLIEFFAGLSSQLNQWPLWQINQKQLETFLTNASGTAINGLGLFLGFFLYKNVSGIAGGGISANITFEQIYCLITQSIKKLEYLGNSTADTHHLSGRSFDFLRPTVTFEAVMASGLSQDSLDTYLHTLQKNYATRLNAAKIAVQNALDNPSSIDSDALTLAIDFLKTTMKFALKSLHICPLNGLQRHNFINILPIQTLLAEHADKAGTPQSALAEYELLFQLLPKDASNESKISLQLANLLTVENQDPIRILGIFNYAYITAPSDAEKEIVKKSCKIWISGSTNFDPKTFFKHDDASLKRLNRLGISIDIVQPTPSTTMVSPQSTLPPRSVSSSSIELELHPIEKSSAT